MSNIHRATLQAILTFPAFHHCKPRLYGSVAIFSWRDFSAEEIAHHGYRPDVLTHNYGDRLCVGGYAEQCHWETTGHKRSGGVISDDLYQALTHRKDCAIERFKKYGIEEV